MADEAVQTNGTDFVELAADIVSAYVSNNSVPTGELPALINEVHSALKNVGTPAAAKAPRGEPAVPIKKSITGDYLISLFDGKKYKSLKRRECFLPTAKSSWFSGGKAARHPSHDACGIYSVGGRAVMRVSAQHIKREL